MLSLTQVMDAVTRLNNLYGRGDVIRLEVRYRKDNRTSYNVESQLQYGTSKFIAMVINNTVRCRGHQFTVKG